MRYGTDGAGDVVDHNGRVSGFVMATVLPTTLFGGLKLYLDPFIWRLRTYNRRWGAVDARDVRRYCGLCSWGDVNTLNIDWLINR